MRVSRSVLSIVATFSGPIAVAIFGLVLFYHDIQQNISSWASI